MVSNKVGTQNWSKASQPHDFKNDGTKYTPANSAGMNTSPATAGSGTGGSGGGKDNEQSIGEKLNQIANPGGKDPTKQARKAHNTLDKDDFMKLMLTQMKNQDPMSPLQSHEMAAQLAQFTSLEQLYNVNKNLEGLGKSQEPLQKFEALNFLGKSIKSDSKEIFRTAGDQASDLRFSLGSDAIKGKLTILDDQGQVVKTIELGGLKKGANKIAWSGADNQDRDVRPGHYLFSVEAQNVAGRKVAVQTATHGTITGVNYTSEGPMLMIGDQKIRLQDVQKIEDEGLREKQMEGENHVLAPQGEGDAAASILGSGAEPGKLESMLKAENQQRLAQAMNAAGAGNPEAKKAYRQVKVKPENKPEAKLTGAVIPLEVASGNNQGASHSGAVSTGGAFGSR